MCTILVQFFLPIKILNFCTKLVQFCAAEIDMVFKITEQITYILFIGIECIPFFSCSRDFLLKIL